MLDAGRQSSPRVSVIVTAWNVGPYVDTALQSILDADLDLPEIVVVDDGSCDETAARIAAVIARSADRALWRPIHLARNTPGGVGAAANIGLDEARGERIVFLDGDDWLDPPALRRALERLDRTGADMLFTDCEDFLAPEGRIIAYPDAHLWDEAEGAPTARALQRALLRFAPMPWRKIYRRDFLERERIRFPVGDHFFEDTVHHWDSVLAARRIALMRAPLHMHRIGGAGQTIGGRGRKFLAIFGHHDRIRDALMRRDVLEEFAPDLAEWLIRHAWWAAERVDAAGLYAFFDAARRRIAAHDGAIMDRALQDAHLPPRAAALMAALIDGDRTAFALMFVHVMLPR
jgi:glycosyltransferase involved in cell wall biosynthesis